MNVNKPSVEQEEGYVKSRETILHKLFKPILMNTIHYLGAILDDRKRMAGSKGEILYPSVRIIAEEIDNLVKEDSDGGVKEKYRLFRDIGIVILDEDNAHRWRFFKLLEKIFARWDEIKKYGW